MKSADPKEKARWLTLVPSHCVDVTKREIDPHRHHQLVKILAALVAEKRRSRGR